MLAPLLALTLLASPKGSVTFPNGKAVSDLRAFLNAAGAHAPVLNPGPLGRAVGSALAIDALDPSTWKDAGLDPNGSIAFHSDGHDGLAAVVPVKDSAKLLARARANLASAGTVSEEKKGGVTTVVARRPGAHGQPELSGAVAVGKGKAAIWMAGADLAGLRAMLDARPLAPERSKGLSGPIALSLSADGRSGLAAGLAPSGSKLDVDLRVASGSRLVGPTQRDLLAHLKADALLTAHATLTPAALRDAQGPAVALLQLLAAQAGHPLPPDQLAPIFEELSGPVGLVVTDLDANRGAGSTTLDRYFLAGNAYVAQVKDAARVQQLLTALVQKTGAQTGEASKPGLHARLQLSPKRAVFLGLTGDLLYFANDLAARDTLLAALPAAPDADHHAGEVVLDGPRAAAALGRLSILDAARSNELAALFALAVEAGPLLKATGTTTFSIDDDPAGARIKGTLSVGPAPWQP